MKRFFKHVPGRRTNKDQTSSHVDNQQYVPEEIAYDPYKLYLYNKAIRKGKEKERILRINIIGNYGQGKTSLAKNLRGESSEGVTSTNGIEINRYLCQRSEDGRIAVKQFETDDQEIVNRIANVALTIKPANTSTFNVPKPKTSQIPGEIQETRLSNDNKRTLATSDLKGNQETDLLNNAPKSEVAEEEEAASELPERKSGPSIPFSTEEYELFSNVIEKQNCQLQNFLDIWDFGGQYIFYATHTLFHSKDALYLLVFDLTSPLDKVVRDENFPNETGDRDMAYFAKFWIESIDAYTGPGTQVILVGTHKDELANPEQEKDEYFKNVRSLLAISADTDGNQLNNHIQREDFVVDNKNPADSGIKELLDCIVKKHQELVQTTEIPARWIQLEKALNEHKEKKVVSFQDVMNVDKNNKYSLDDTDQVKLFLNYQHDKGRLFYFDDGQRSDPIVLDPKFLIDAFKCIITSEQFVTKSGAHSEWKKLTQKGLLTEKLIDIVWSGCDEFMRHKDVLLKFLKKHNILSQVLRPDKRSGIWVEENLYIVPSLLRDVTDADGTIRLFLEKKRQAQIRYVLKFSRQSIVHMLYHRIVAAALGIWPVANFRNTQLFFEHVCVFEIQETVENISTDHAAVIELRPKCGTVELRIVSLLPQDVRRDLADQLRRFVESFVTQEFKKIKCYRGENLQVKPFSRAYRCNHKDHATDNGSFTIKDLKENENVRCPDNCTHEDDFYRNAKYEWFAENTDEAVYANIRLTEKELGLLSQAIGKNWELLGPTLGVMRAAIEHIKLDHPNSTVMQIFKMLHRWKDTSTEEATLDVLVDAFRTSPVVGIEWDVVHNIRDEFCRKNIEKAPGFIQPLSDKICTLNESLSLGCKLTVPRGEVTWKKNGQVLIQDGRIKICSDGYRHTLLLENVNEDDAAKYECIFGDAVTQCDVSVQDAAVPLEFIKRLADKEVGSMPRTAEFSCEVNREVSDVQWYYRGQRVSPSDKYKLLSTGTVHTLKIRDVTEQDEGRYRVVVEEKMSEACLYVEYTEEETNLLLQYHKQKKGEGLDVPDSGGSMLRSSAYSGQPFKRQPDDTLSETMVDALSEQVKSVGVLVSHGHLIGTVFRVGTNYVMTAFHVVRAVIDPAGRDEFDLTRLESDDTYINFDESAIVPPVVQYRMKKDFIYNTDLDVAVLEISNPSNLPMKMNLSKLKFSETRVTHVSLIGYGHTNLPKKMVDVMCKILSSSSQRIQSALVWLQQNLMRYKFAMQQSNQNPVLVDNGYLGYNDPSKITFDCLMEHGGAGSPAVTHNNELEVVGVLTQGLPEFYFNLSPQLQAEFPTEHRLELGAKMTSIYEWIKATRPQEFVDDLFN